MATTDEATPDICDGEVDDGWGCVLPEGHDGPCASEADHRLAQIAGLRELADFLDGHPDLPLPQILMHAQHRGRDALAAWIDGLTDIDVRDGIIDAYRGVARRFAGLEVCLFTRAEYLGEMREVPGTVTVFTPLTADEIRERAVQS